MSILKKQRERFGYTQQELATKTSLSLRTIQRLEASNKLPKGHTLTVLADAFELEIAAFQELFLTDQQIREDEHTSIKFINLSVLAFLGIPFGNIFLPLFLWRKYRRSELVDEIGRRIINAQIIFSALLSILLSISPFLGQLLSSKKPMVLIVLFIAYGFNILVVIHTATQIQRKNFNFLNIPIRLL